MHHASACIAYQFTQATSKHGGQESPLPTSAPERGLRYEQQNIPDQEEYVGAERGNVFKGCVVFGAGGEGAEGGVVPGCEVEDSRVAGEGEVL